MLIENGTGKALMAEWVVGPTIMGARVVVKLHSGYTAADVAAFFDGSTALHYTGDDGTDTAVEGYSVMVAMTRKDAHDGWLVSLARP